MAAVPGEHLRYLVRHMPTAIAVLDCDMRYIAASSRWIGDYQLEGRDVIGESHYVVLPEMTETWKSIHRRALAGEVIRSCDERFERADGSEQWLTWEVCPWYTGTGEIGGIIISTQDVTDRVRAEQLLRENLDHLQTILNTAIDAIITINERGLMQTVNPAAERMFGYTAAEMLGQNVNMLMPSPYREEHDGYLERHLRTGENRIIGIGREVHARHKNGTLFPVDLAVSRARRNIFTGIVRDITDRKRAEARAIAADRMASIGTLAAGLGHDMNNVLLPVRARLNALRAAGLAKAIPPAERQHVEEIRTSVAYLQQLADGLHFLALDPDTAENARGDGGSTTLHQWWTQAGPLISKAVPKHVKVTASFPENLPPVTITAHGLTQAVLNLVVNAGEAIPPPAQVKRRQGLVRLSARSSDSQGHVRLSVADNGAGMSEEVRKRAFEMFFTTKTRGLGTGLGLALVRKVVDQAGGQIDVESSEGKGTTITLILPAVPVKPADDVAPLAALVTIADGRAAAIVRDMLEASGVRVSDDPAAADEARVWVLEPKASNIESLRSWHAGRSDRHVVLLGSPADDTSSAWRALSPTVIAQPDDFQSLRAALGEAVAGMDSEGPTP